MFHVRNGENIFIEMLADKIIVTQEIVFSEENDRIIANVILQVLQLDSAVNNAF